MTAAGCRCILRLITLAFAGVMAGVSAAEPSSPRPPDVLSIAADSDHDIERNEANLADEACRYTAACEHKE